MRKLIDKYGICLDKFLGNHALCCLCLTLFYCSIFVGGFFCYFSLWRSFEGCNCSMRGFRLKRLLL